MLILITSDSTNVLNSEVCDEFFPNLKSEYIYQVYSIKFLIGPQLLKDNRTSIITFQFVYFRHYVIKLKFTIEST